MTRSYCEILKQLVSQLSEPRTLVRIEFYGGLCPSDTFFARWVVRCITNSHKTWTQRALRGCR